MYDVNTLGVQNDTITTMKIPLNEKHWTSQTYLLFGRCFSFAFPKKQKLHGVSFIRYFVIVVKNCSLIFVITGNGCSFITQNE